MHIEPFEYARPVSLGEFEALLARRGDEARILAGGTDILVLIKEKLLSPRLLVDVRGLDELDYLREEPDGALLIGAGTTIATLEHDPAVKRRAPALAYASSQLGSPQVRAMATMAGNVCHGSPSAETPPVLLAHGAELVIGREGGERTLPLSEFYLSYRKTALQPGEYLKAFRLQPLPENAAVAYVYRGLRKAMEIDMVNVGFFAALDDAGKAADVRIALGAVGPIPYRATEAEKALIGETVDGAWCERAGELAEKEATPIDDVRASAAYRNEMVRVLTQRAATDCLQTLGKEV